MCIIIYQYENKKRSAHQVHFALNVELFEQLEYDTSYVSGSPEKAPYIIYWEFLIINTMNILMTTTIMSYTIIAFQKKLPRH